MAWAEVDQNGDGKWAYCIAGQRKPYKVEHHTTGDDGKADTIWAQDKTSRSQ